MSILSNGTTLQNGKYTIVKMLGQGSFGITYLATTRMSLNGQLGNMDVDVNVTIKEFFISMMNTRSSDGKSLDRTDSTLVRDYKRKFIREAVNLSHLQHDNIVKVLEVFEENNTAYYVMEFIDGGTVDDLIKRNGPLTAPRAISISRQVCSALQYMHGNRMLHLDLKPKNIMLTKDGKVKLIDFGLAKQYNANGEPEESTSLGLGTPGYAPIEQATYQMDGSLPVTLDIYALGATMYKMLTGIVPPESSVIINEGLPFQPLRNAGVPSQLIAVVSKAMAPLKRDRIQSVQELDSLLSEIEATLATVNVKYTSTGNGGCPPPVNGGYTPPVSGGYTPSGNGGYQPMKNNFYTPNSPNNHTSSGKKHKIILWSAVGGVLFIAFLIGVFLLGKDHPNKQSQFGNNDVNNKKTVISEGYVSVEDPVYSEELAEYANMGIADAQYDLGICYENGSGVEEDEELGVSWIRKAAKQGQPDAQAYLGICYQLGHVVEMNEEKAAQWFMKSAEQGNSTGQLFLGACYENGTGVAEDVQEAAIWYRKSALQGEAVAQLNLGVCYLIGKGVEEDEEEAVEWLSKAAAQEDPDAEFFLGLCYENGVGVEEDLSQAIKWYQKSADQGQEDAKEKLEELGRNVK